MKISPITRFQDALQVVQSKQVQPVEKVYPPSHNSDSSSRLLSQKTYEEDFLTYHSHPLYHLNLQHGQVTLSPLQTKKEASQMMASIKDTLIHNPEVGYYTQVKKNYTRVQKLLT